MACLPGAAANLDANRLRNVNAAVVAVELMKPVKTEE
jgi:hypothetical protein